MPLKPDLNMNVMNEKNAESFDMHNKFMEIALSQAELSLNSSDVPVGAVIVKEGEIIGRGFNTRELSGDGTAHAPRKHTTIAAGRRSAKYLRRRNLLTNSISAISSSKTNWNDL